MGVIISIGERVYVESMGYVQSMQLAFAPKTSLLLCPFYYLIIVYLEDACKVYVLKTESSMQQC